MAFQDLLNQLTEYSLGILPAFLFALLISAVLTEVIPDSFFEKILSSRGVVFILTSSIIGALIPLCTCGMIPLASKLQKKGASWLIVISFLTSGNASSITALLLTLVLGLKITFLRFFFSVIFGILVAYIFVLLFRLNNVPETNNNIVGTNSHLSLQQKIIKEFLSLTISFGPWVLVAIFVGSIISLYVKPEIIVKFSGAQNPASPFLLAIIGFPFYFCAGADIPVSKALLEKGASLGSVLSFMIASPGVNLTSFFIYQKWLGLKNAFLYLAISALVCGFIGLIVNLQ